MVEIEFFNLLIWVRCHWPACAVNCPGLQDSNFHNTECEILASGSPPRSSDLSALLDYYRPDALLVLKCLLLQLTKPEKWTQLMDLQSHEEERLGSQLQKLVKTLLNIFLK